VRIEGFGGTQPQPVVVTGRRGLPSHAAIAERRPIVFTSGDRTMAHDQGVSAVSMPGPDGVDLEGAVKYLGGEDVLTLLIEGGPTIAGSALRSGIVDRVVLYYGAQFAAGTGLPAIAGTLETIGDTLDVSITSVAIVGSDIRVDATIEKEV
jgi:diaminohydroxyphosphoribosylaminopyrimidine deaminase/5-amino-6-(5-phosphoribosylamino)uracil reductase